MSQRTLREPPKLPGALPVAGHIVSFGKKNPHAFMMRLRQELGDAAEFRFFRQKMVLLTGTEASEAFYRVPDEAHDRGPAYKFMTPIFGKGVLCDVPIAPERSLSSTCPRSGGRRTVGVYPGAPCRQCMGVGG